MNVSNTDAIINVQGLNKAYGRNKIFQNLDLVINYGEVCALIGINGSGKTTLLKILSTLTKPDSGSLSISGLTSRKNGEDIRKLVGLVTHNHLLYNQLTGYENLKFVGELYRVQNIDEKIKELSSLLKLDKVLDKRIEYLSHGFQKRVSIARALIHNPLLLLLDEPESNLDHLSKTVLFEMIKRFKESGKTILVTTHNIETIVNIADRILLVSKNKISLNQTINTPIDSQQIATIYKKLNNELS
jgi:ABC-type multidrug transport system ATPase subunit